MLALSVQARRQGPPVPVKDSIPSEGLSKFVHTDEIIRQIETFVRGNLDLYVAVNKFLINPVSFPFTPPKSSVRAVVIQYLETLTRQHAFLRDIEGRILKRLNFDPNTVHLSDYILFVKRIRRK
jgi:glyoxylate utilization-related uncharacterized protein